MFGSMFSTFAMMGNYDDRKIGRWEDDANDDRFISTAQVNDSPQPYETAIHGFPYNGGSYVIVESYDSRTAAEEGHARWVATMTGDTLPETITMTASGPGNDCAGIDGNVVHLEK